MKKTICYFFAILKSISIYIILILLQSNNFFSQTQNCGDDAVIKIQRNALNNYDELIKQNNLSLKNYIDNSLSNTSSQTKTSAANNYLIPVVFHVIHPVGQAYGTGTNISYQQIISQLNALNAAFSKNYPTYNGQTHPVYAQNTDIQFCLAKNTSPSSVNFYNGPTGIENGVMRYADNAITNHQITTTSANSLLGLTHPNGTYFPFTNYLNIWIVSTISNGGPGTIMGYAPKPIMASYPLDGVVMRADVVGDNTTSNNFTLNFGLTQGKILVHEIGHYLNLYHIFEGGCAGANPASSSTDACDLNGDFICDIEPCTTQNFNCNLSTPNTCIANYTTSTTINDMVEDYMSYADDDCMNTFTQGQKLRMQATLNVLRNNLWQTTNLAATGVMGPNGCTSSTLYSTIVKGQNISCLNTALAISNSTLGNTAISWSWTLTGGNPNIANTNSVSVTYTAPGLYWAKLAVSDGSVTVYDSISLAVTSCSLDPKKLNRSNWLFGNYCSVNFSTGQPVANTIASVNNTIKCRENSVSVSDSSGNLLFYSNGVNLWNGQHTQVNLSPVFGYTFNSGQEVSSVYGFMAIPLPKSPTKYMLLCVPPFEIIGNYLNPPAPAGSEEFAYVIYDVQTQTISPVQHLLYSGLPYRLTEDLTLVPHCNGVDYWLVIRGAVSYLAATLPCSFYSFLINQNGLSQNQVPVTSGPFTGYSYYQGLSTLKSNKAGDKLVCKVGGQGSSSAAAVALYNFNSTFGTLSNEHLISTYYDTLSSQYKQLLDINTTIFSPSGQYLYVFDKGSGSNKICQFNTSNLLIAPKVFTNTSVYYAEIGPDNNIYFPNAYNSYNSLSAIINPDSWTNSSFLMNACTLNLAANIHANGSILNCMEADRPSEVHPILVQNNSCSSVTFSLSPCWSIYNATWNYGDNSSTATGSVVVHTYTATGIYTVSLTLNYNGQNIPVYTKTINIINPSALTIVGPTVICKGSTFLNNYSATNIAGFTYSWTANNSSVIGLSTLSNINLATNANGFATISVQASNGGCNAVATKTILIDSIPNVQFTNTLTNLCLGNSLQLVANPANGTFSGIGVTGNTFSSNATGTFNCMYTYANSNGCSNTANITLSVNLCTGLQEYYDNMVSIHPNPVNTILTVESMIAPIKIEILNSLGQIVINDQKNNSKINNIELNVLAQGIYFVRIQTAEGTIIKKIIKQ